MNTDATTDRTAAAIRAARKAGARLGLTFTSARWAGCKSFKEAFAEGGRYYLTAHRDGGWTLRGCTDNLLASGKA
jgi:hypothetical protein